MLLGPDPRGLENWTKWPTLRGSANASNSKSSGRVLDGVMIQEAAQGRLALNVRFHRRCGGVIKAQRNNITDSLVWAASIVIGLDDGERAAEVGLTEENQAIERLPDFLYMTLRERICTGVNEGVFGECGARRFSGPRPRP